VKNSQCEVWRVLNPGELSSAATVHNICVL
jgi:hypothetical protein